MDKINKLSLPISIIIASVVLGGFYYVVQVNKQESIERQQRLKIEQDNQAQLAKELKEQSLRVESREALENCIFDAEQEAGRLNQGLVDCGKSQECKGVDLSGAFADVKNQLEKSKSECFKKFPQ